MENVSQLSSSGRLSQQRPFKPADSVKPANLVMAVDFAAHFATAFFAAAYFALTAAQFAAAQFAAVQPYSNFAAEREI